MEPLPSRRVPTRYAVPLFASCVEDLVLDSIVFLEKDFSGAIDGTVVPVHQLSHPWWPSGIIAPSPKMHDASLQSPGALLFRVQSFGVEVPW